MRVSFEPAAVPFPWSLFTRHYVRRPHMERFAILACLVLLLALWGELYFVWNARTNDTREPSQERAPAGSKSDAAVQDP